VLTTVKLTRTAYAQLVGQKFYPPKVFGKWNVAEGSKEWRGRDVGMKIVSNCISHKGVFYSLITVRLVALRCSIRRARVAAISLLIPQRLCNLRLVRALFILARADVSETVVSQKRCTSS
jgi:hypothetical protein